MYKTDTDKKPCAYAYVSLDIYWNTCAKRSLLDEAKSVFEGVDNIKIVHGDYSIHNNQNTKDITVSWSFLWKPK